MGHSPKSSAGTTTSGVTPTGWLTSYPILPKRAARPWPPAKRQNIETMTVGTLPRIAKRTVEDLEVQGKRVLVRVDYNVPLDEQGMITDDTRIRETLPTLNLLLQKGSSLVLCAHLGRPKGQANIKYSLKPVAKRLEE